MYLAILPTRTTAAPSANAIVEAFRPLAHSGETLLSEGNGAFRLGDLQVHVQAMPGQLPDSDAAQAVQYTALAIGTGWSLPDHAGYVVVSFDSGGTPPPPEKLGAFTRVVAAVAEAAAAVAVYWEPGRATHPAHLFVELAATEELPLPLWIGVRLLPEGEDRFTLLSLGMDSLGHPELQVTAPRGHGDDAMALFYDLLGFAVGRGQPLQPGERIGRSEEAGLDIHEAPHPTDEGESVRRVDLEI